MRNNTADRMTPVFRLYFTQLRQVKALQSLIKQKGSCNIERIYVNSDLFLSDFEQMMDSCVFIRELLPNVTFWLALPPVLRNNDLDYLSKITDILGNSMFSGILCGNLEGIGYFSKTDSTSCQIVADHHFYLWNRDAIKAFDGRLKGACLPLELRSGEQKALLRSCESMQNLRIKSKTDDGEVFGWDKIIYGRIPFMFTANCVAKTGDQCRKNQGEDQKIASLKDRTGTDLPVLINCRHCFNIIYNSVPLSLHNEIQAWSELAAIRLNFTTESFEDTKSIANWFLYEDCEAIGMPFKSYTKGNEKRGVL